MTNITENPPIGTLQARDLRPGMVTFLSQREIYAVLPIENNGDSAEDEVYVFWNDYTKSRWLASANVSVYLHPLSMLKEMGIL